MNLGDVSKLTTLRLTAFKARFTVQNESTFHYRDGEFCMDPQPTIRMNEEILKQLLVDNPGICKQEFETLAGSKDVRRNRARRFLDDGVASGMIRRTKGDKNADSYAWVGTEKGKEKGL